LHETESNDKERAFLVGLSRNNAGRWEAEEHLSELALLADTAGALVCDQFIQEKNRIDPAYFVGRGKAEDIATRADEEKIDLLIFDDDLSPAQIRNLERLSQKKILDRSGIILDIFARRAKTKEAKTQVELAQLNYLLPRLTRQWTHLSRQVGGIGTRGPGETQLEVDRRLIRERISSLKKELAKITKQREVRRRGRELELKVALVGYTNAGKSTLMNALTEADVFVEDRLFATLDATIRKMPLPDQSDALLIDTVGFIRKLPHHLVASFMSTLEEAKEADILLLVSDVSHPQLFEHMAVVRDVLNQLQILDKPTVCVFNKIDKLNEKGLMKRLKNEYQPCVFVSATKELFLSDLREVILNLGRRTIVDLDVTLDIKHSELISKIYSLAEVTERNYNGQTVTLHFKTTEENRQRISSLLSKNGLAETLLGE
jgi:GTP-binding protein HflX